MRIRTIVRGKKREAIIQHFIGKVNRGLRSEKHFKMTDFASELSHVRCLGSKSPVITPKDVQDFYYQKGINWRNVTRKDAERADGPNVIKVRPRAYAGSGAVLERKHAYDRRNREKRLYALGVFKPREIEPSAFVQCKKESGAANVRPADIKRAGRILELLNGTESKAMHLSEFRELIEREPLFSKNKNPKRPLTHLKALGIIVSHPKEWVIVSDKFVTVNQELLKLKHALIKANDELRYMTGVIQRKYVGLVPPMTNPDGLQIADIENKVKRIQRQLNRTRPGRRVLENIGNFPRHLLESK